MEYSLRTSQPSAALESIKSLAEAVISETAGLRATTMLLFAAGAAMVAAAKRAEMIAKERMLIEGAKNSGS